VKTASIICLLTVSTLFANDFLQSQTRPLPIIVTCRESSLRGSYVLQVQNSSNDKLDLWLQAKGKVSPLLLPAGKMVEIGWAQGYRFDANNLFLIGGSGYDTIRQVMPNVELSLMRLEHRKEGGFELSFSQSYVQKKAQDFKLPIKVSYSRGDIEIKEVPQMELREGSNRMYAHCVVEASGARGRIPLTLSFIPEYIPATGQLVASQIQIEKSDQGIVLQQYIDFATDLVNAFLPAVFSNYVLYTVPKSLLPAAKLFRVHDASVTDGRLVLAIF